jgi:hypothetical protein
MKWLQSTYTQRYNSRHKVFGHLFQGRYKALVVDGAAGNYFEVVITYIHLNPAWGKLIKIGKERLSRYRWSSYPLYLKGTQVRPGWLVTERVMGEAGLKPKEVEGYEAYMETRVLELGLKEGRRRLEEEWKRIRRGWYLGGDGFRGRMIRCLKQAMGKGLASSYGGEAKREHGEGEAVAWGQGGGIGARAEKHGAEAGAGVVAWEADDSGARVDEPAALDGRGIRSDEGGAKGEWE